MFVEEDFKKTILVVDDEKMIRNLLNINLTKEGYNVIEAVDGLEAVELATEKKPDLILLDVMIPKLDGLSVCKRIKNTMNVPILMVTAKDSEVDKILGLELGADDYVTKPFSPAELTARVDALYRRLNPEESDNSGVEITSGPFVLNVRNRTLEKNGTRLKLTQIEYLLMKLFMENPGKAMSREEILHAVWGYDFAGELKTVDVNMRRLRIKIEKDPTDPEYLTTVWGYGYKWGY
jgi:DNA-binding response OmpR family regulator